MKAIIIAILCVTILVTIVPNDAKTSCLRQNLDELASAGKVPQGADHIKKHLDKMASNGETFNGIFKPSVNGHFSHYLINNQECIIYKGNLVPRKNMEVMMKFLPDNSLHLGETDFQMYTYLNAVVPPSLTTQKTNEEKGIPSVYYFGKCMIEQQNYTMMAITSLDEASYRKIESNNVTEQDMLIVIRDFLKLIKHIHSNQITFQYLYTAGMVFQKNHGFFLEFETSEDVLTSSFEKLRANMKKDILSFLKSIYKWFYPSNRWHLLEINGIKRIDDDIIEKNIKSDSMSPKISEFKPLHRVIAELAKFASNTHLVHTIDVQGKMVPFYDHVYQILWQAIGEKSSLKEISIIKDPFNADPGSQSRPKVNFQMFENAYGK